MHKPVVVGSSFSGALISLQLSRSGIDHLLIGGDEPAEEPRLGESLNECAAPDLFGEFGRDFPDCFHTKSHISLLNGPFASMVQIANPRRCKRHMAESLGNPSDPSTSGFQTFRASFYGRNLMHVDRIRLDREVYHRAIQQPQCEFVKELVETVEIDEQDRVSRIVLQGGRVIDCPKYVFDTTGFRAVVGRAAKVGIKPLSNEQRVVWTHFERKPESDPVRWWRHGTNLLKLTRDPDGIDGIAWMIPIGATLSVGISVDNDKYGADRMDKATVIQKLNDAYARRGVDYPQIFRERIRPIMELTHRYFVRDRAYGGNWLLVAGGYVAVWFPSSAGLWTTTAAVRIADKIIDDPLRYGARYQESMNGLLDFHGHLEKMIHGEPFQSMPQVYRFWSRWLAGVPDRLGDYLNLVAAPNGRMQSRFYFLKGVSKMCKRLPELQMLVWSFHTTRVVREPAYARQNDAFRGYFDQWPFKIKNYLRGHLHWWGLYR
ncbi:MAG: NAD(P)/FAD-dependent oxidoreductase [Planctomycetaceae bacterium]